MKTFELTREDRALIEQCLQYTLECGYALANDIDSLVEKTEIEALIGRLKPKKVKKHGWVREADIRDTLPAASEFYVYVTWEIEE